MIEYIAIFIPILALSIPIVAILSNASIKKKQAGNPELIKKVQELEDKVKLLEGNVTNINDEVLKLEDKNRFLSRLLEEK